MGKKRILFLYTGYEQGSWGTIAYSRPFHYYIMPGILYCVSALKADAFIAEYCDIHYRYFNRTVESLESIGDAITREHWDLVGYSTYCWNSGDHLALAQRIKAASPDTQNLFGGPEVVLQSAGEADAFFNQHPFVDGVVLGDAESKLPALVRALLFADSPGADLGDVHGFAIPRLAVNFESEAAADLNTIPSIYPFEIAIRHSPASGLAMVYETGRGCPNRCIFCKFGHRSTRAIRIAGDRVERELQWLFAQKIACVHFADAVFDQHLAYAKEICRTILKHNVRTSVFFYCSLVHVDDELAALYAATQSQICVGVQSTNPAVLRILRRAHNKELFTRTAPLLGRHGVNFYIDLIFGLPGDNVESFMRSFDQVVKIRPAFIMLFPLTLIRGTELADNAQRYRMISYAAEALASLRLMCDISYEHVALYEEFTPRDLAGFDAVSLTVFYFYNRFYRSLSYLVGRCGRPPFRLFQQIGARTKAYLSTAGMHVTNTTAMPGFEAALYEIFTDLLAAVAVTGKEHDAFKDLFNFDILRLVLLNAPQRERVFNSLADKRLVASSELSTYEDAALRVVRASYGKTVNLAYSLPDLFDLASLRDEIPKAPSTVFVHAPYSSWDVMQYPLTPAERFLVEYIPESKGVRVAAVVQAALRQFKSADREVSTVLADLQRLSAKGIIALYRQE